AGEKKGAHQKQRYAYKISKCFRYVHKRQIFIIIIRQILIPLCCATKDENIIYFRGEWIISSLSF
ncbi:hypothetical protein JXL19_10350, partial [bacterium]|nr:hypothetical protein [bacterium]